jgi:uncharacterized protein (TIGR03437 family)
VRNCLFYVFACTCSLSAQIIVTTAVGGAVRSGVPAENVQLNGTNGITHDLAGNLVFCEHFVVRRINPDGTIQTIAGTGMLGFSGDSGPAIQAQLSSPASPQYDSKGNLYFLDSYGTRIRRVDTAGVITTFAGTGIFGTLGASGPLVDAQIDYAASLVIAPDDSIYMSEQTDIRRITAQGTIEVIAELSSCTAPGICAHSLALDANGNIYFAEGQVYNGTFPSPIYRLSPDGTINKFAGFGTSTSSNGDGGPAMNAVFHGIGALALDASGNMYVADSVDVSDVQGFIIADSLIKTVSVIRRIAASDGTVTTIAGQATSPSPYEGPALQASLGILSGLAPNSDGGISFSSTNTIGELTTQSAVQLLAGRNVQLPPDGVQAAGASWLSLPVFVQMAPSRSGNFYFADHCMIRMVGPNGILATAAGTGNCAATVPATFGAGVNLPPIYSLAVDSHDNIFAGMGSGLYSFAASGTISAIAGLKTPAVAIAFDSQDRLYVVGGNALSRVNTDGSVESLNWTSQLPGGFNECCFVISAISIDASDNVYLLDAYQTPSGAYILYRFTPDGIGSSVAALFLPLPVTYAVDSSGGIWYVSALRLEHEEPSGLPVSMTAPCCGYSGDGAIVGATLGLGPSASLVSDASGDIYMLDDGNAVIRKISGAPPSKAPAISPGGIVNAASLLGGAIAPGELISIFGSNFLSSGIQVNAAENNILPTTISNLRVAFTGSSEGGANGAITAAPSNQINVFVPYEIAGNTSVTIAVSADYVGSAAVKVPVAQSAFGLSTADASGSGQGAILNQDGSYNSDSNPASAGSVVSLFGTGEGLTKPALPDGALVISTPYSIPNEKVTVTIGDQPAEVLYAGAAPFLPTGVLQINAQIPAGVTGDAPVLVSIGGISTSRKVTVAVK